MLPTGATEQHGRHLPVLTDGLMAETIALRAADVVADQVDVLVASLLPYGCSHHHMPVGGALSVSQRTYVAFIVELGESLVAMGARRLVLLNGHGGNDDVLRVVANELVYERCLPVAVAAVSYWAFLSPTLAEELPGPLPGHAGNFETSCLLALDPHLVRLADRFPADDGERPLVTNRRLVPAHVRLPGLWEASDGVSDSADQASPEYGARALDAIVHGAADFLLKFHQQPLQEFPSPSGREQVRSAPLG